MSDAESRPLPDIERALALIVAGFNGLYALTTATAFAASARSTSATGTIAVTLLVCVPLLLTAATAAVGRTPRRLWAVAASSYLLALVIWAPTIDGSLATTPAPWLMGMLIPAVLQVQMATRRLRRTVPVALVLVAVLVAVGTGPGGLPVAVVAAEVLLIAPPAVLMAAVLALVVRTAARTARAQEEALRRISASRLEDVTETERERTDALLHDTVLTTLLQAAAAEDVEGTDRARRMAENAVRVLAHVGRARDLGAGVRLWSLVSLHEERLAPLLEAFDVTVDDHRLEDLLLPEEAAEALIGGLMEAMDNSVRHAGDCRRTLLLRPLGPDGVCMVIDDDGLGFDVSSSRGGSITARIVGPLALAEGRAELRSAPGTGTSVRLTWGSVSLADVRSLEARMQEAGR